MVVKAFALACAILVGNASAAVLINFEGVGNGASVNDYYNGGSDSQGNAGVNYGIRFSGGTIHYDALGAHIEGAFTVSFASPLMAPNLGTDHYGLSFLATRWDIDGGYSWQYKDNQLLDSLAWVQGVDNPYCTTQQDCLSRGYNYIPNSTLFGYFTGIETAANRLVFNVDAADDLFFGATGRSVLRRDVPVINAEVPEPGSIALLGLGAVGLFVTYRRKSAKNQAA